MTGLFGKKPSEKEFSVRNQMKELRKLVKDKQYDKAIKIGDEILRKTPHNHDVHFIVGGIYYMRGKLKTALVHFDEALKIGEYDPDVLLLKANAHFKLGQIKDSIASCEKLKEIDPKNKSLKELESKIQQRNKN
ncbi:MAG: hypothetical protein DWQ18_07025 [Crenarchaeota archaeon]|nr:MAG: hypothetical protein DWQ17_02760 [Thermoproteota archaeon]RDJ32931.1 MAG: hypothetical protein DWQ18_07025 [Thermoproteota archaeon]RDJ35987.1 MAG: hypothetical protein DWQ13_08845 [Thermoproteota archaeon]RDJ38234.1 MAG: hypothetical protein DWQ19_00150 [Thermoproteota archaeon]